MTKKTITLSMDENIYEMTNQKCQALQITPKEYILYLICTDIDIPLNHDNTPDLNNLQFYDSFTSVVDEHIHTLENKVKPRIRQGRKEIQELLK